MTVSLPSSPGAPVTAALFFIVAIGLAAATAAPPLPPSSATIVRHKLPQAIDVDFAGGSVSDLIAAIDKAGANLSVIGDEANLRAVVPAFSLRHASFPGAVQAAAGLLDPLLRRQGLSLNITGLSPTSCVFVVGKPPSPADEAAGRIRHPEAVPSGPAPDSAPAERIAPMPAR